MKRRQKLMRGFRCIEEIGVEWQVAIYEVVRMMLKAANRRGEFMRQIQPKPRPQRATRSKKRVSDAERARLYRKRHPSRHHDAVQRSRVKARRLGKDVGEMVAAVLIRKAPRPSPGSRLRSHTNDRQDLDANNALVSPVGQS